MRVVAYSERVVLPHGLTATAFASGHTLGGAAWRVKCPSAVELAYLSATSLAPTLATPFSLEPLRSCDVCVVGGVASREEYMAPSSHAEQVLFACQSVVRVLKGGGSVLAPCSPTPTLLAFLEQLLTALHGYALYHAPVYVLGPVGAPLLAYLNIVSEWMVPERADRVAHADSPSLLADAVRSKRIRTFVSAVDGAFGQALQVRCARERVCITS